MNAQGFFILYSICVKIDGSILPPTEYKNIIKDEAIKILEPLYIPMHKEKDNFSVAYFQCGISITLYQCNCVSSSTQHSLNCYRVF